MHEPLAPDPAPPETSVEIRSYFVRGRNALLVRADFGPLYVDHFLHLARHNLRPDPAADELLRLTLAALALHSASRPIIETTAWTINLQHPLLNLFATVDHRTGFLTGNSFTEGVRQGPENIFCSEVVTDRAPRRRSIITFDGSDIFRAVEQYYLRSEQRPARYFTFAEEDYVLVSAQPDCDMPWFDSLTDHSIRTLDQTETLSLLETRSISHHCGCSHTRMMDLLVPSARQPGGLDHLFESDPALTITCPRCSARHRVTRESLEAHLAAIII